MLAHSRRKVLPLNVTENPGAWWTGQQIFEAVPWSSAPKYLLRDRDAIYGGAFQKRLHGAPRRVARKTSRIARGGGARARRVKHTLGLLGSCGRRPRRCEGRSLLLPKWAGLSRRNNVESMMQRRTFLRGTAAILGGVLACGSDAQVVNTITDTS